MKKILLSNIDRCTGCQLCEQICSLVHTNTSNPERSRIRILKREEWGENIPTFCQQCEDPPCVSACPVCAIQRNETDGVMEIDQELCIQCEDCISACPFKSIYFDRADDKIAICDLCGGDPKCAMFCQTKAIEFLDKDPNIMQRKRNSLRELDRLLKLANGHK